MKNKIIPFLIGTFLTVTTSCTTLPMTKGYEGPIREVSVKVVYDEEYAHQAKKKKHIKIVEKASKPLEEQVGIKLVIKEEGYWDSDDYQNSMHLSRMEMEAEAGHGKSESGQGPLQHPPCRHGGDGTCPGGLSVSSA